jgi:hypothetical protein
LGGRRMDCSTRKAGNVKGVRKSRDKKIVTVKLIIQKKKKTRYANNIKFSLLG